MLTVTEFNYENVGGDVQHVYSIKYCKHEDTLMIIETQV